MQKYKFDNTSYVHNLLADVLNQTLVWINEELLPRSRFNIISTYDKAVERIKQLMAEDPNVPPLPAITLDPQQPTIPDATALWRFSQLSNHPVLPRTHEPIIETDDFRITPIFQPIRIEMETIFFLPSVYEYLDVSLRIFDFFGGVNRWVRPRIMNSLIIVPQTLLSEEYENPYDGTSYVIDLSSVSSTNLIKSIAEDVVCFETLLTPRYQLTGVSDGSTKYGGDTVADWRATFSMVMEVFLPTWFLFETDVRISAIEVSARVSGSLYPQNVSEDGRILDKPLPVTDIRLPDGTLVTFVDRYIFICDQDYDPDDNPLVINLPLDPADYFMIVWSYGGEMTSNVHYTTENQQITFKVPFKKDDTIEFFYYK